MFYQCGNRVREVKDFSQGHTAPRLWQSQVCTWVCLDRSLWSPSSRKRQAELCFTPGDGRLGAAQRASAQHGPVCSLPLLSLHLFLWFPTVPVGASLAEVLASDTWEAYGGHESLRKVSAGSPKSQPEDPSSGGLYLEE